MRVKLFGSYNRAGTGGADEQIQAGALAGLYLRWSGTAATGVTPTVDNLGVITITDASGVVIHQCRFGDYWRLNQWLGGRPEYTAVSGGAFAASCFIPFRYGTTIDSLDNNVLLATGQERITVPGIPTSVASTANCAVYGVYDSAGVARYVTLVRQTNPTLTAAFSRVLATPNLRYLMLSRPTGGSTAGSGQLPNDITVESRNGLLWRGSWEALEAWSDLCGYVEASSMQAVVLRFGQPAPQSWQDGGYVLTELGAYDGDTQYITQFGARFVDAGQFANSVARAIEGLAAGRLASSAPAPNEVAPVYPYGVQLPSNYPPTESNPGGETIRIEVPRQSVAD